MPPPAVPTKSLRKGRPKKIKQEVESSDTESESPTKAVRSTRSKRNNQNNNKIDVKPVRSSSRRNKKNSDVLIVPEEIPIIDLLDSSIESTNQDLSKKILESPKQKETNGKKNKDASKNIQGKQTNTAFLSTLITSDL